MVGTVDEDSEDGEEVWNHLKESDNKEDVGNYDEFTDSVGIGGGSEDDRGLEEELERMVIVSN